MGSEPAKARRLGCRRRGEEGPRFPIRRPALGPRGRSSPFRGSGSQPSRPGDVGGGAGGRAAARTRQPLTPPVTGFHREAFSPDHDPPGESHPAPEAAGAGVPADTHPPHSGSERGLEPAAGGRARTRPPRPPPSAGSSRPGPSSDRGAPQPRGQGRERAAAAPGSDEAPVPGGESAASTNGLRGRCGAGISPQRPRPPGLQLSRPHSPPSGTGLLPNGRPRGAPRERAAAALTYDQEDVGLTRQLRPRSLFSQTPH